MGVRFSLNTRVFTGILSGILTSVTLCACEPSASAGIHGPWTAERETLGDTAVVRTVSGSVWGDTMVLVPELAIGEMEGEGGPYLFGFISGLEVDPQGRIFVLDWQAQELRVFSPLGEHLLTIGGPGEGPVSCGDRTTSGSWLTDESWSVTAAGASPFTPEGAFLETWPILSSYGSNRPFYLLPTARP